MHLLRTFGIGEQRILAKDAHVPGVVTKVTVCRWISVKTTLARICATSENTIHPHIITFSYQVDGNEYEGNRYIWVRYRCPKKGEEIEVYYDPENPAKYACYALGPERITIRWW